MRHPPAHAPAAARRPRLRRTGGPLAVLTLAGLLAVATPATAHDPLVGSDPADGAVLSAAPTQVVLTFAAPQAGIGAEVAVTGPDGATWSDGPAQTSDVTVTQPLLPALPDGAYTVTWRSVAQDGHPVSGVFGFTLELPVDPAAGTEPDAEGAVDATADVVTAPEGASADSEPSVQAVADPLPPRVLPAESGGGWRGWYSLLLALVLGGAAVALVVRRRRAARG